MRDMGQVAKSVLVWGLQVSFGTDPLMCPMAWRLKALAAVPADRLLVKRWHCALLLTGAVLGRVAAAVAEAVKVTSPARGHLTSGLMTVL